MAGIGGGSGEGREVFVRRKLTRQAVTVKIGISVNQLIHFHTCYVTCMQRLTISKATVSSKTILVCKAIVNCNSCARLQ